MAGGKLGSLKLNPGIVATVYTVPATVAFAVINVGMVNIGNAPAAVRLAFATGVNPAEPDYIEYDLVLEADGGILERTGQILSPGEKVMCYSSASSVVARVSGVEEAV